jgi:hypothetical protein
VPRARAMPADPGPAAGAADFAAGEPGRRQERGDGYGAASGGGSGDGPQHRGAAHGRHSPVTGRTVPRPEGGGRAAGKDAPAPARQWPILVVISAAAIGLVVTAAGAFRAGTIVIGVALLVGAALRWGVTAVGMLAVRSRFTDVITYGLFGVAIVLLALMAQPDPLIRIPFLEDIIHFSVR